MLSLAKVKVVLKRHAHFLGPGLVAAVAYIDPGNWATDLSAGANYGYKLLFIVFIASLAAVVLQTLSVRLGSVTGRSLPQETRKLFLGWEAAYPKYRRPLRAGLYSLWALAEIAIIATDLAELLGSAIALNLLFPKLPLFAGVLITAADVMLVLVFFRSDAGRQGMLLFEVVIVALVLAVFISFAILLHLIKPDWREVFFGLVPSSTLVKPGALYVGVGIIGATVMPHALFLGSHLAGVDRLNMVPTPPKREKRWHARLPKLKIFSAFRRRHQVEEEHELPEFQAGPSTELALPKDTDKDDDLDFVKKQEQYELEVRQFDRIAWVDLHVIHASIDVAYSLLGFALTINAAILTLAGAAFYYGSTGASPDDATIEGAHKLIKSYIGNGAAIIFAIALLCAGQSASITATLAGQVVSEGFLEWKTSPMVRRLITRLIGVIPAAVVASAVGNRGLDTMLVASQVILSIVLPTVTIPLVYLCSRRDVMVVEGPEVKPVQVEVQVQEVQGVGEGQVEVENSTGSTVAAVQSGSGECQDSGTPQETEQVVPRRSKVYTTPRPVTWLGWLLCFVVVLANCYVIVQLARGEV